MAAVGGEQPGGGPDWRQDLGQATGAPAIPGVPQHLSRSWHPAGRLCPDGKVHFGPRPPCCLRSALTELLPLEKILFFRIPGFLRRRGDRRAAGRGLCVAAQCSPELMESQGGFMDIAEANSQGRGEAGHPGF